MILAGTIQSDPKGNSMNNNQAYFKKLTPQIPGWPGSSKFDYYHTH